ncbi:unnamed protein product [Rhodiola kirilowii]
MLNDFLSFVCDELSSVHRTATPIEFEVDRRLKKLMPI